MLKDSGIEGKVALVTGGSRGIGAEIVRVLAKEGAEINFFYHSSQQQALELQRQAEQEGLKVHALQVDVRDRNSCHEALENIYQRTQKIDILVNNSGITRDNLLAALEQEDVENVINTNIIGVFNVTHAVVPFMMRQRSGKIINISSVSAEKGGRGQVNYAASKGAINALTKALAVELAPRNITVNAIAPGIIDTRMTKELRELAGEQLLSKILLKRYGKPQEIAYAVGFLASKYADYINGTVLSVDGGFKMS